jgi:hypothetical protein
MPTVDDMLDRDAKLISGAYTRLINCAQMGNSIDEARELHRELRVRSKDLAENLRKVLYEYKVPIPLSEVRDLNSLMARQDTAHLLLLAQHYINRFLWADAKTKMKCLTAAYYGMRDLAECVEATPVEYFYKEIIKS